MALRLHRMAATLIIILVPVALFWRLLLGGQVLFWGVSLLQFYPWRKLAVEMIRAGHVPLWTHALGNGTPLAANLQSAVFYPLNFIYLIFPVEQAMGYSVVLHVVLAGLFMQSYGRAVGLGRFAATVAALSYMLGGFIIGRGQFLSMVNAAAWLPLLFLLAERLARRRGWADAAVLGLVLGVQFLAGHAQLWYYGLWGLGAYVTWRAVTLSAGIDFRSLDRLRKSQQDSALSVGLFALAVLIAAAVAAVQIGPTLELARLSQRAGGAAWDFAMTYSFWPWRLITLFAPDFFGNPAYGDYWGYANYWEDAAYIGVLPLIFALIATTSMIINMMGKRQRGEGGAFPLSHSPFPFFSLLAAISILLAMGQNTPLYPFVFRYVPGFGLFQAPARLLYLYTFSAAVLAGLGAETFRATERSRFVCRLAIAGALSMFGAALAVQFLVPAVKLTFVGATARFGLLAAIAAALLLKRDAGRWEFAATVFVAVDLTLFGYPLNPAIDPALYRAPTRSGAFLRERADFRYHVPAEFDYNTKFNRYLQFDDFGPSELEHWLGLRESLLPNMAVCEGLTSADNYEPLPVGRYAELMDYLEETSPEGALQLLRLMNVGYVVGEPYLSSQPLVFSDTVAIYRVEAPLPRAYFVPAARTVADPRQLLAGLADPSFDPRRELLLEPASQPTQPTGVSEILGRGGTPSSILPLPGGGGPPLPARERGWGRGSKKPPKILDAPQPTISLHYRPNGVTINVIASRPGYLVVGHTYYPGWQATVDGQPTSILRANFAFQAVALPEGEHEVRFDFVPLSFRLGLAVSLCTLATMAVGFGWAYFKRRGREQAV